MSRPQFPPAKWIASAALALAFFVGVFYIASQGPVPEAFRFPEPTNFVKAGTLVFPNMKDHGQDTMYLAYPNPNGPTTTMELVLDEHSVCATPSGSLPCMAMSVQYHMPFGGKPAIVEGIEREARLVVRKVRVLQPGETPLLPGPGLVYIPWPQAVSMIERCAPRMITQTHSLNVHLDLKSGEQVVAVEPRIDEVFKIAERTRMACGNIPLATE